MGQSTEFNFAPWANAQNPCRRCWAQYPCVNILCIPRYGSVMLTTAQNLVQSNGPERRRRFSADYALWATAQNRWLKTSITELATCFKGTVRLKSMQEGTETTQGRLHPCLKHVVQYSSLEKFLMSVKQRIRSCIWNTLKEHLHESFNLLFFSSKEPNSFPDSDQKLFLT